MHLVCQPRAGAPSPSRAREAARRELGRLGERLAAAHLERRGLEVIARNVRTRHGELDLIAFDGVTLVFVEVKARRALSGRPPVVGPLAGLTARKQARVRRLAVAWLSDTDRERPRAAAIRFDAIGVLVDGQDELLLLEHLEAAW